MPLISAADPRLTWVCPQQPEQDAEAVRLARFPREATAMLAGQIGPVANLRSSSGCGLRLATDSPWVDLHLTRLRHHQPFPSSVALEVEHATGVTAVHGPDVRERQGDVVMRLPTGLERDGPLTAIALWLPLISTCAVAGISLADGAVVESAPAPAPRWLAIGDSLTQGFSVQSPLDAWVPLDAPAAAPVPAKPENRSTIAADAALSPHARSVAPSAALTANAELLLTAQLTVAIGRARGDRHH